MEEASSEKGKPSPDSGPEDVTVEITSPSLSLPPIDGYLITGLIARGGQAQVYDAVQNDTGRHVAIKVLHFGSDRAQKDRGRFEREFHILESLDHPNIVSIFDRGETPEGRPYLVMDYIDGKMLNVFLSDHAAADSESEAASPTTANKLELFIELCDAVHAAHVQGIVHRDLKPSNIIVDPDGHPHVLDFGLARGTLPGGAEGFTTTGVFVGSLRWASPEQVNGSPDGIDVRSDVYSLGMLLYHLITGGFPYEVNGQLHEVLDNILHATPTPISETAKPVRVDAAKGVVTAPSETPKINPALELIVLKSLSKAPETRYQHAGEFGQDITRYLAGNPTLAKDFRVSMPKKSALQRKTVVARAVTSLQQRAREEQEQSDGKEEDLGPSHTQVMTTPQALKVIAHGPASAPKRTGVKKRAPSRKAPAPSPRNLKQIVVPAGRDTAPPATPPPAASRKLSTPATVSLGVLILISFVAWLIWDMAGKEKYEYDQWITEVQAQVDNEQIAVTNSMVFLSQAFPESFTSPETQRAARRVRGEAVKRIRPRWRQQVRAWSAILKNGSIDEIEVEYQVLNAVGQLDCDWNIFGISPYDLLEKYEERIDKGQISEYQNELDPLIEEFNTRVLPLETVDDLVAGNVFLAKLARFTRKWRRDPDDVKMIQGWITQIGTSSRSVVESAFVQATEILHDSSITGRQLVTYEGLGRKCPLIVQAVPFYHEGLIYIDFTKDYARARRLTALKPDDFSQSFQKLTTMTSHAKKMNAIRAGRVPKPGTKATWETVFESTTGLGPWEHIFVWLEREQTQLVGELETFLSTINLEEISLMDSVTLRRLSYEYACLSHLEFPDFRKPEVVQRFEKIIQQVEQAQSREELDVIARSIADFRVELGVGEPLYQEQVVAYHAAVRERIRMFSAF